MITSINMNVSDVFERQLRTSGVELGATFATAFIAMASVTKQTDRTIDLVMTESYDGAMVAVIIESLYENWSDGRSKESHYPYNFMMYKLYPDQDATFIGYDNQRIGNKTTDDVNTTSKRINKVELNKRAYSSLCENTCYSYIHYCEKLDNTTESAIRGRFEAANNGSLFGEKVFDDGSKYVGMMYAETQIGNGKGTIYYKDGGIIEGYFLNGALDGKGKYTYPNGIDYSIINFDHGKKNGPGVMYIGDTTKIERYFDNDKEVGISISSSINGDSLFINNDSPGNMKPMEVRLHNGDYFIGKTNKKMNAKGIWYLTDGSTKEMTYKNGEKNGMSITKKPDGTIIKEHWKKGKKHGNTIITDSKGYISVEHWKDDKKIE